MTFDGVAFGRRLAAARVWAGLEPKQVAAALGVSDEAIYQMERGDRKRPPNRPVLQALSDVLGQPSEWFLDGDQPPWSQMRTELDEDLVGRLETAVSRMESALGRGGVPAEVAALDEEARRSAEETEQLATQAASRATARRERKSA